MEKVSIIRDKLKVKWTLDSIKDDEAFIPERPGPNR